MKRLAKFAPYLQSVLRIVAAYLYLSHGTQKLFAFPATAGAHAAPLNSLMGAAGIIETLGGALMLLGLFTRPVAFIISGQMAYAFWTQHAPRGVWYYPILNGGELPVLFCFLWLYFCAAGPGPISVDRLRGRS
jgi:putative oxidoreductase